MQVLKEDVELVSSVYTAGVYAKRFHFLEHLLERLSTFGDISVLNTSVYKRFKVRIKRAYLGQSERRVTRMRNTVMLTELQRRGEQHILPSNVGSSL